jgi:hypothetical protein
MTRAYDPFADDADVEAAFLEETKRSADAKVPASRRRGRAALAKTMAAQKARLTGAPASSGVALVRNPEYKPSPAGAEALLWEEWLGGKS